MNSNKNTIHVKVIAFLFVVLAFISGNVFAQDTTLTTVVPKSFDLELKLSGKGSIVINNRKYDKDSVIEIERLKPIEIEITPFSGYQTSLFSYNGENRLGEIKDNKITISEIECDSILIIKFSKIEKIPETGLLNSNVIIWFFCLSIILIALILAFRKKHHK